jgi:hypothetical protein
MDNRKVFEKYQIIKGCSPEVIEEMVRLVEAADYWMNKCKSMEAEIARLERLSHG